MSSAFNFYDAMTPLLNALGWHGEPRRLLEIVPHLTDRIDVDGLRNIMVSLGYDSKSVKIRLNRITREITPAIFISRHSVSVIHKGEDGDLLITDCKTNKTQKLSMVRGISGTLYSFFMKEEDKPTREAWLWTIFQRFHSYIYWLLGLGFFTSILSTVSFIFISLVYDWVVPTNAEGTLLYLMFGLLIALAFMEFIHVIENKALSYLGARLDMIIGIEVVRKILSLPVTYVDGISVAAQVARIRQFDAIRETFTGPLAKLMMEMPFMIIFLIVMGIIGGPIVLIPLVMTLIFFVVAILMYPALRSATRQVSSSTQERRKFLIEGTSHLMTIKNLGAEEIWVDRFKEVGASVALAQRRHETLSAFALNLSQSIMKIAGLATIIWGTYRVTQNLMTTGELIALVMLVWRALSPVQAGFMILGRADQIADSVSQINRLMAQPSERRSISLHVPHFKGFIRLNNVTFRYPSEGNPAIQGVMLEAQPGEIVAIIGQNGSGKSTLVKLLLGFYYPQAGTVTIDGTDIRQFDPVGMRQAISYVPQQNQFFHGTIEQNLKLSVPDASDEQLVEAADMAGLLPDILNLPEGLETPLNDRVMSVFSSGFLQKLNLARAYLRKSSIMILDEPGNTLDYEGDERLKATLESMKKERTMIVVTHRPSLINLADRILVLQDGTMRAFGPKDKVLEILKGGGEK